MLVCQASVVILEAPDLKGWKGCLESLGKKGNEAHLEWMASRVWWDSREDLGSQELKERLDSSEYPA